MGDEGQAVNKPSEFADQAASDIQMDSVINRRSRWLSSLAAIHYCNSVARDEEIKVRDSDRATAVALFVCLVLALVSVLIPELQAQKAALVIAADLLVGLALLMYVANRFGIVTTFQPRQARLTGQLMLGSSLLGIFLASNVALAWFLIVQNIRHLHH